MNNRLLLALKTPEIISQSSLVPAVTGQCDACSPVVFTKYQTVSEEHRQDTVRSPVEIPTTLAVWLHLTDRCNLRCAYCYLPHKNADMSLETGCAAIESTFRAAVTHRYREVKLKYAGGEPLIRFSLVKELHWYAQQFAGQHGPRIDEVVLSNGLLLTKEIVKEMQALGLRLTLSLGETTRAIELALDGGLAPGVSITVNKGNLQDLPELLGWVLERDLAFSLNFVKSPLPPSRKKGTVLEEAVFIQGMLDAYKLIESHLPRRSLLASLADLANFAVPHVRRCSVGHSYLVFDPYGGVSKCQMQMGKPVTDIHADDPLTMIRADRAGIQNIPVDEKEDCQTCRWRYWCAGGCPLETFRATGRYDRKSPNCDIYKALYPEVLRLEGLRLLKYASAREKGV